MRDFRYLFQIPFTKFDGPKGMVDLDATMSANLLA
jgi:hypothetical protein